MISNKRKTIGVLLESTLSEYANEVCQGIIQAGRDNDIDILIFTTIGRYGQSNVHYAGEQMIYDLPPYEKLDGIIVLLDTILVDTTRDLIISLINERCHCPVVSIREIMEGACNLVIDNTTCMRPIIEHFIDVHHLTRLCFMTGPADRWYAQERLDCFLDIMKERGLPVSKHNYFYGDFWKNMAKEACDWFLSVGEMPEAIICANDHMAGAVVRELILRGYRIPEDICVSGYDGLSETLNYSPSISTITVPFYEMGLNAVNIINERIKTPKRNHDYQFNVRLEPRESCGCHKHSDNAILLSRTNWYLNLDKIENRTLQFNLLSIQLGQCYTLDDLPDSVAPFIHNITNYRNYCMCLCENTFEREHNTEFTENMELRVAFLHGVNKGPLNIPFSCDELLPESVLEDEPQAWYFSPLHFEDRIFGYEAVHFNNYDLHITGQIFPTWNILMGNKLQDISNHSEKQKLINQLEYLYNRDALTGMYNRRGLLVFAPAIIQKAMNENSPIFLAIIDLDGLKQINDNYGHIEGDHVLNVIHDAIKCSCNDDTLYARTGGDEFVILLKCMDMQIGKQSLANIQDYLDKLNDSRIRPYDIHASMGAICRIPQPGDTVETFITESDAIMYQNKIANKLSRGEPLR